MFLFVVESKKARLHSTRFSLMEHFEPPNLFFATNLWLQFDLSDPLEITSLKNQLLIFYLPNKNLKTLLKKKSIPPGFHIHSISHHQQNTGKSESLARKNKIIDFTDTKWLADSWEDMLVTRSLTHTIHGTGIFTYIYNRNQPFM